MLKCSDESLYTGITTDLNRRVDEHNNSKKAAKYTCVRRPVEIIYYEFYEDKSGASKREHEIKKFTRIQKLGLIK